MFEERQIKKSVHLKRKPQKYWEYINIFLVISILEIQLNISVRFLINSY